MHNPARRAHAQVYTWRILCKILPGNGARRVGTARAFKACAGCLLAVCARLCPPYSAPPFDSIESHSEPGLLAFSGPLVVGGHRQFGLCIGGALRRHGEKLAA